MTALWVGTPPPVTRKRRAARVLLTVGAIVLVLLTLAVADHIGQDRRCAWLSDHRDTHPNGWRTYCADR